MLYVFPPFSPIYQSGKKSFIVHYVIKKNNFIEIIMIQLTTLSQTLVSVSKSYHNIMFDKSMQEIHFCTYQRRIKTLPNIYDADFLRKQFSVKTVTLPSLIIIIVIIIIIIFLGMGSTSIFSIFFATFCTYYSPSKLTLFLLHADSLPTLYLLFTPLNL